MMIDEGNEGVRERPQRGRAKSPSATSKSRLSSVPLSPHAHFQVRVAVSDCGTGEELAKLIRLEVATPRKVTAILGAVGMAHT
jgi:hypothetical protein